MDEWNRDRPLLPNRASLEQGEAERHSRRERKLQRKKALDELLDKGLEESFPASDPVAVTQPPHSPHDKRRS
jgi:hypothetical protein